MEWIRQREFERQFEQFVAESTDSLFRTGFLMTWDTAETEDLLQDTFVRVARRWNRVRSMDRPIAYARRILVNLVIDGAERRSRQRNELTITERILTDRVDDRSMRLMSEIDDLAEFRWALTQLPPRQRAVLVLRYWNDLSEKETAEILGCSLGTVRSTASRGADRVRRLLRNRDSSGNAEADDVAKTMKGQGDGPC
jgi:RNA polymerase sigma-70 factor (sigma-E family)